MPCTGRRSLRAWNSRFRLRAARDTCCCTATTTHDPRSAVFIVAPTANGARSTVLRQARSNVSASDARCRDADPATRGARFLRHRENAPTGVRVRIIDTHRGGGGASTWLDHFASGLRQSKRADVKLLVGLFDSKTIHPRDVFHDDTLQSLGRHRGIRVDDLMLASARSRWLPISSSDRSHLDRSHSQTTCSPSSASARATPRHRPHPHRQRATRSSRRAPPRAAPRTWRPASRRRAPRCARTRRAARRGSSCAGRSSSCAGTTRRRRRRGARSATAAGRCATARAWRRSAPPASCSRGWTLRRAISCATSGTGSGCAPSGSRARSSSTSEKP